MRAYFILEFFHPNVPEISKAQIVALMQSAEVCLVSALPPKAGERFTGDDGNEWRVVSVDPNGRTAEVCCVV